jgi:hypothetical protein
MSRRPDTFWTLRNKDRFGLFSFLQPSGNEFCAIESL